MNGLNRLGKELQEINAPFEEWHLGKRNVDHLDKPPHGIFYNRMSASSHTRGHRYAPRVYCGSFKLA